MGETDDIDERSDADLLRLHIDGHRSAFRILYRRLFRRVHRCVLAIAPTGEAEDITQEAFLRLSKVARVVPDNVKAWLSVVAVNEARYRAGQARRRAQATAEFAAEIEVGSVAGESIVLVLDEARSLNAISQKEYDVVKLRLDGFTRDEIAERLQVALVTVKRRYDKAVRAIRSLHSLVRQNFGSDKSRKRIASGSAH